MMSFFNLFRSYVGIGVMALPFSVNKVGPLLATIFFLLISAVMVTCTYLLLEIADNSKFKGNKYETVGELVWGLKGKYFI